MNAPLDLIIDCDPGIDDALALWLAAAHPDRLRLLAVTTVAGNRPVDTTCSNALRLLDAAGLTHVPVFRGAAQPLDGGEARCNLVHGEDGLGGVPLPLRRAPPPQPAWQYIVQTLNRQPLHTVTLVTLGPLTNLALAEQHQPGVLRRARQWVAMGGALTCPGNVTPHAEFNFHADPLAAQRVLQAQVAHSVLLGLDITRQVVMHPGWLASLHRLPGHCAALARAMLAAYASQDPLLHDACPIAWLLAPQHFSGARWQLQVDTLPGPRQGQLNGVLCGGSDQKGSPVVLLETQPARVLQQVHAALGLLP